MYSSEKQCSLCLKRLIVLCCINMHTFDILRDCCVVKCCIDMREENRQIGSKLVGDCLKHSVLDVLSDLILSGVVVQLHVFDEDENFFFLDDNNLYHIFLGK